MVFVLCLWGWDGFDFFFLRGGGRGFGYGCVVYIHTSPQAPTDGHTHAPSSPRRLMSMAFNATRSRRIAPVAPAPVAAGCRCPSSFSFPIAAAAAAADAGAIIRRSAEEGPPRGRCGCSCCWRGDEGEATGTTKAPAVPAAQQPRRTRIRSAAARHPAASMLLPLPLPILLPLLSLLL